MKRSQIMFYVISLLFTFMGVAKGEGRISLTVLDIRSSPGGNVDMVISTLDENGIPVKELSKANFKLNVEGKEVKEFSLEPYSSAQSPLSVILGIDVSGSMDGVPIKEAKKGASIFLDQLDKEDFTLLMVFGNSVRFLTDFTRKKHEVREKIESLQANEKLTFLYQATHDGLEMSSKAPTSRVAVILLTDGRDEGSPLGEEDVMAKIRKHQIPFYTLGFGPKAHVEYLQKVAAMSGGYFLSTPRAEELSDLYSMVLDQLKNQYLIRFSYSKPAGEYTSILTFLHRDEEVTARRAFLHVITEPTSRWKELFKSQVVWIIIALVLVAVGIAIVYRLGLLSRPKPEAREEEAEAEEEPTIRLMIRKKFHPISPSLTPSKTTATVAMPLPSKGEVGLEIDLKQPPPIPFALVDKKNRREFNEIIIARYDKDREHLLSGEKAYLFLSDLSVTRPSDERRGHARIFIDMKTGTYQIEDLGSTSGTKVNGKGLNRGVSLALVNDDAITVGNIHMKFYDRRPLIETRF